MGAGAGDDGGRGGSMAVKGKFKGDCGGDGLGLDLGGSGRCGNLPVR